MYPNKIRISNGEGQVSITAISRAFEVGQVAEDFDLSKYTSVWMITVYVLDFLFLTIIQ